MYRRTIARLRMAGLVHDGPFGDATSGGWGRQSGSQGVAGEAFGIQPGPFGPALDHPSDAAVVCNWIDEDLSAWSVGQHQLRGPRIAEHIDEGTDHTNTAARGDRHNCFCAPIAADVSIGHLIEGGDATVRRWAAENADADVAAASGNLDPRVGVGAQDAGPINVWGGLPVSDHRYSSEG